jgi:hypothetical protein
MIYYHVPTDTIFESHYVDMCFMGLRPLNWDDVIILGEL